MATFLVLPPRELLEHAFAAFFRRTLPGVSVPDGVMEHVLSQLPNTFAVHREDLPDGRPLEDALVDVFGAEFGDRVVEIGPPRSLEAATVREWVVSAAGVAQ